MTRGWVLVYLASAVGLTFMRHVLRGRGRAAISTRTSLERTCVCVDPVSTCRLHLSHPLLRIPPPTCSLAVRADQSLRYFFTHRYSFEMMAKYGSALTKNLVMDATFNVAREGVELFGIVAKSPETAQCELFLQPFHSTAPSMSRPCMLPFRTPSSRA